MSPWLDIVGRQNGLIFCLSCDKRNEILLFNLLGHFFTPADNLLRPRPKQSILMAVPSIEWQRKNWLDVDGNFVAILWTILRKSGDWGSRAFRKSFLGRTVHPAFSNWTPINHPRVLRHAMWNKCFQVEIPPDIIGTSCGKTIPKLSLYIKSPLGMKAVHWSFRRSNTDTGCDSRSHSLIFLFRFTILRRNRKLVWFSNKTSWWQPFEYLSNLAHWEVLLDSNGDQVWSTGLVHGLGEHQALFQSVIMNRLDAYRICKWHK